MRLLTEDEAHQVLKKYYGSINKVIRKGWDEYYTEYKNMLHKHSKRSRASLIHDLVVSHFKEEFMKIRDVKFKMRSDGLFLINFDGKISAKIKKLNDNLQASNIVTGQTDAFLGQLEFPGLPKMTRVHIGYVPERFWSSINKVVITCPNNGGINWNIDITRSIGGVQYNNSDKKTATRNKSKKRRYKAKKLNKRKEGINETGSES